MVCVNSHWEIKYGSQFYIICHTGIELVAGGDVIDAPNIIVEGNASLTLTAMLTNSSQQVRTL